MPRAKKPVAILDSWDGEYWLYDVNWKKGYVSWSDEGNDPGHIRRSKLYGVKQNRPYFKHDGQTEYLDDFIPRG